MSVTGHADGTSHHTHDTTPADIDYSDMPPLVDIDDDLPDLEDIETLMLNRTLSDKPAYLSEKVTISNSELNTTLLMHLTGDETLVARKIYDDTKTTVQTNTPIPQPNWSQTYVYEPIDHKRYLDVYHTLTGWKPDTDRQLLERLFDGTLANLTAYKMRKAEPASKNLPELTDVCNELPGIKSVRGQIAKDLAYAFMNLLHGTSITAESDIKERQKAYVHYTKFKSMLKRAYTEQQTAKNTFTAHNFGMCKLSKYHKARVSKDHYEEAKSLPLSDQITKPTPMEVQIAPVSELQAIFDRLAANDPALPVKSDEIGSYEQFTRGAYYTDGRVDMCKQVVGPDHIGKLCDSIRGNPHVKHFLLGNNIAGYHGAACISSLINDRAKKCYISTWYLAGNCIDGAGMELLAGALTYDTDCKQLWLKRNPIGVTGAKALAKMFAVNNTIEVLDLDNTAIFDEGCIALFAALANNTSVRSIYLDANGLTAASANAIAAYFAHKSVTGQTGIKQLSLSINRLGDDGVHAICDSLFEYPLTSLTLGSNRIELAGLKSILSHAAKSPTLEVLDIGYYKATADMGELPNSFGNDGARLLACFILLNTPVKYLSFHNSHITDLSVIEAVMPFNTNLVSVTCEQGTTSSKIVHQTIERNQAVHYPGKSTKEIVRNMKHGADVWVIDSIYRNKM